MGFNTVALILNDRAHDIVTHPEPYLREIDMATKSGMGNLDSSFGGLSICPSVHADGTQIILAGQNRITPLGVMLGHDKESLIRWLAGEIGYSLRKKP